MTQANQEVTAAILAAEKLLHACTAAWVRVAEAETVLGATRRQPDRDIAQRGTGRAATIVRVLKALGG